MSTTIAVDVAKSVFEIALSHRAGRVAKRYREPPRVLRRLG
jgi:hypothetical protein